MPGSRHYPGRPTQNESFFIFSRRPRPGLREESAGVYRCGAPSGQHAGAGKVVHASEQLHRHASPSFLPQVPSSRSPPASGAERSGGSRRAVGIPAHRAEMHSHRSRCTATLAEMHNHPLLCSRRKRTLGARSLGLTESGSLAGPGPKLTTCLGTSMVRGHRPLACPKGPTRGQRESVPGADSLPTSSAELPSPLAALSQVLR